MNTGGQTYERFDSRSVYAELVSPASFMIPEYTPISAWRGHAPFLFWLFDTLRPKVFVELGTHHGYSYFCACQASRALTTGTTCIAVDTWQGDEHAGHYDNSVFQTVDRHNREKYAAFSTLIRLTFDEALTQIKDGSINLLHIDGRHRYEDVHHDFECWIQKLSAGAIVLFHDTMERHGDFGVHRQWAELVQRYPSFNFEHDHGLGVISVGPARNSALRKLFDAANSPVQSEFLRQIYSRLGTSLPEDRRGLSSMLDSGAGKCRSWWQLLQYATSGRIRRS